MEVVGSQALTANNGKTRTARTRTALIIHRIAKSLFSCHLCIPRIVPSTRPWSVRQSSTWAEEPGVGGHITYQKYALPDIRPSCAPVFLSIPYTKRPHKGNVGLAFWTCTTIGEGRAVRVPLPNRSNKYTRIHEHMNVRCNAPAREHDQIHK